LNDSQVDQYLVLPDRQGEEIISWETSGLQQTQNLLPQDYPLSNEDSTAYRVDRSRVTAVVHNVGGFGGTPRVQLADNHVTWNSDRTCFGVAAFDVTPLQMTECLLDVPPRLQITHISVAGVPVTWRTESENRLWIPLGPEQLPQRIDIVFSGRLGSSGMVPGERIEAPFLADLPVEQTLWTIQGPSGAAFDDALLTHTRTNEVEQARIRADSATLALKLAESLTLPLPEVGFESWTRTWERRRDQAMRIVEGTKDARSATENDIFEAALRDLQETENDRESPIRFAVQGGSSSVNIQFSRYKASDLGLRAAISAAVACLGLMLVLVMRKFRFKELIEQSWYALGIAASVIYWLWFTPSFLGLLAMGLCLTAALWPVRKSRIATRTAE